ncbi:TetR/AcrR family transcriptional regulator [Jongsikchunia kroppenstedtii]|uniref:TetR/AcrR family transcriptional regulator n=1 Tax=Jongsikchunia kroppenstedtii TaxID=1121721 RepID=UPI00036C66A6|nr:TetR/AcrR family transcriptional regulator [Jongsikchunia kroppenstedtii]
MKSVEPPRRGYRQDARARSAEATHRAILEAARALSASVPLAAITLQDIAAHAGVTVQTVLRRFGSRDGVIEAAIERFAAEVRAQRAVLPGDIGAAVNTVVDHYEDYGDAMMLLLGQETVDANALRITTVGRELHDSWVADAFAPTSKRQHRLLVVATDLYTWKLLRRDRGLDPGQTAEHMYELCRAIIGRAGNDADG